MVRVLRPPAERTASSSGRCITPAASRRASAAAAPPRTPLHHAPQVSSAIPFSAPLLEHSRRKLQLVRASVVEVETSAPSTEASSQHNGESGAVPAVHPVELPQELRDMVRILPPPPSLPAGLEPVRISPADHTAAVAYLTHCNATLHRMLRAIMKDGRRYSVCSRLAKGLSGPCTCVALSFGMPSCFRRKCDRRCRCEQLVLSGRWLSWMRQTQRPRAGVPQCTCWVCRTSPGAPARTSSS